MNDTHHERAWLKKLCKVHESEIVRLRKIIAQVANEIEIYANAEEEVFNKARGRKLRNWIRQLK